MERGLRVSVVRRGRMVEDRFLPPDGLVAAGLRSSSVRLPPGFLSAGQRLFDHVGGRPVLRGGPGLTGQVAQDGRPPQGLSAGDVVLGPDARGWVDLGDAKLFFQVAPRPVAMPRRALPADVRSRLRAVDRRFAAVLALVALAEAGALWNVAQRAVPTESVGNDVDEPAFPVRHGQLAPVPPLPVPVAPPLPRPGPVARPARARGAVAAAPVPRPVDKVAIGRMPIFVALGAVGGALEGVLAPGALPMEAIDRIRAVGRVTANGPQQGHRGAEGPDPVVESGPWRVPTQGPPSPPVRLLDKRPIEIVGVAGDVPEEPVPGDPDLSAKIYAELKARQGGIQRCFEHELRRQPGLHGRVALHFTLESDGRLADVGVEDQGLRSPQTGSCIASLARTWRLAVRPSGDVPVSFPLVFSGAD